MAYSSPPRFGLLFRVTKSASHWRAYHDGYERKLKRRWVLALLLPFAIALLVWVWIL